jgi:hypothetical protein
MPRRIEKYFWTAPVERSADGAFAPPAGMIGFFQSGVAPRLPPQSKTPTDLHSYPAKTNIS